MVSDARTARSWAPAVAAIAQSQEQTAARDNATPERLAACVMAQSWWEPALGSSCSTHGEADLVLSASVSFLPVTGASGSHGAIRAPCLTDMMLGGRDFTGHLTAIRCDPSQTVCELVLACFYPMAVFHVATHIRTGRHRDTELQGWNSLRVVCFRAPYHDCALQISAIESPRASVSCSAASMATVSATVTGKG